MQVDLRRFLSHLAGAVTLSLIPVVIIAFLSMPSSLRHHLGHSGSARNVTVGSLS